MQRTSSVSPLVLYASYPPTAASSHVPPPHAADENDLSLSSTIEDGAILRKVFAEQQAAQPLATWAHGTDPCSADAWKGASCLVLEEESVIVGGVTHLDMVDLKLSGAVDWAPLVAMAMLREVAMLSNSLSGPLNLRHLPPMLRSLEVADNQFSGNVDLTTLPVGMTHLRMEYNDLTGTVDFTQLPKTMRNLFLFGNKFTGTVDVTNLPPALVFFDMSTNQFTGTVDLTALPQSLETFHFSHNHFTGEVNLRHLPESLQDLDMTNNQLSGTLDLRQLPADLATFTALDNQFRRINFPSTLPSNLKVFTLEPTTGWGAPGSRDHVCFLPTTAALDVSHLRRGEETDVPFVELRTLCQWPETKPELIVDMQTLFPSASPLTVCMGNTSSLVGQQGEVSEWRLPMRSSSQ